MYWLGSNETFENSLTKNFCENFFSNKTTFNIIDMKIMNNYNKRIKMKSLTKII